MKREEAKHAEVYLTGRATDIQWEAAYEGSKPPVYHLWIDSLFNPEAVDEQKPIEGVYLQLEVPVFFAAITCFLNPEGSLGLCEEALLQERLEHAFRHVPDVCRMMP